MAEFIQMLTGWMVNQHPIVQGYIMGVIATGIPGPLNLIAVYKTISGDEKNAWKLLPHFAGWFVIVAFCSYHVSNALAYTDIVTNTVIYFKEHKSEALYIGTVLAILGGIFFFRKKTESQKVEGEVPKWLAYIISLQEVPVLGAILRGIKALPFLRTILGWIKILLTVQKHHSMKFLMVILMVGIVFNPGNWIVFISSYTAIANNVGHHMAVSDMCLVLVGVFLLGFTSWGLTIGFSKGARHWIMRKTQNDPDALERILNKLIGTLLFTLAVVLFIAA